MASALTPRPAPKNEVPQAEAPSLASLMTLAVGSVMVAALYFGREVFLPIVLAVLLAFVLAPFVDLLRRLAFRPGAGRDRRRARGARHRAVARRA